MNTIIRFAKSRLTLYRALRFRSTAVVMADQNLLDAINIGEKNLLDTINIDEPVDISLVGITQNTSVRITQETPVQTTEIEKNKESESTISDIEDYINRKYDELAISSLKKELLQEVHLLIQKEENSIISFLQNKNDHLLTEVNFVREEVKGKNIVIKRLMDNRRQSINRDVNNNQSPFSTDDKSQKPIKDSNGVNSISVAVNIETISQETLNVSEVAVPTLPNTVKANKTNPSKVNSFITVRPRKGDHFSKTSNQDDNGHKKSNSHSEKNTDKDQSKNKRIYILGDSMLKNLKGWEIPKKLKNANVYVKHFASAKVRCMKDHIKPSLREKPDHIVFHVGRNDLVSDRPPDLIAKSIVDVASSMKNENNDVTVSNIIARADLFKKKANEVNDYLSKLFMERNIYLIDHSKTLKAQQLNGSKLHLNRRGAPILQNTVCKFLSKIFN